jgi:phosphoglucosamine mutase
VKLFGTDGIRGVAGESPLDPRTVARVGAAIVRALGGDGHTVRVVVGRDTRESGEWIERALARGVASQGSHVISAGVIPTPAIAYLARSTGFDIGVVISASHNPFQDNGIKVFSGGGEKLTEAIEAGVEARVADRSWDVPDDAPADVEAIDLRDRYVSHLTELLPTAGALAGSGLVIDCANGATVTIAPDLFARLGFDLVTLGVTPDGRNINLDCGSTHMESLQRAVVERGARLGVAFDGDGDRALFVDRHGALVNGDAVLLVLADYLHARGRLRGNAIVATVMSNIGLELALGARGIELVRCAVGDKNVMEEMQRRGLMLGGEQSGHIILADHLFTGDGIATALQVLAIMADTGRELDELAAPLITYPQVLVNVRVRAKTDYMSVPEIRSVVTRVEEQLAGEGRLLVRYSGTEPLLRIMIEGKSAPEIHGWADEIAGAVRTHLG